MRQPPARAERRDIADWLGLLKGSLYYYIKSKDDLLYTVISEVHRADLATIESLAAAEGSALQRLRGVIGGEHAYRGVFRHLIEDGQREGLIRPAVDARLAALSILGSTNWVYRWFQPDGEFTVRQIGEQFADMIIRGLAAGDVAAASGR
jgi:AcrR family transcriptional regulator